MGLAFSLLRLLFGKFQGVGEECNQIHILEITLTGMWGLEVGIPARRLTKVSVERNARMQGIGTKSDKVKGGVLEIKKINREH